MMSGISSGGGNYLSRINSSGQRPDAAAMQQKLFKKIDGDGDGTVSEAELADFSKNAPKLPNGVKAPSFSDMDSDKNGTLTQSEFSAGSKKLEDQLKSQFESMRASGAQTGRPAGPPPGGEGGGLSKDEVSGMAKSSSTSNSSLSSKLTDLADNFDAADTNQDGKVSIEELLKYEDSKQQDAQSSSASSTKSASSQQASLQDKLQALVKSLLGDGQDLSNSGLSVSA